MGNSVKNQQPAPEIDKFGGQCWRNSRGDLHRVDGPAYIGFHGSQQWYFNGNLHRTAGPAVVFKDGEQEWWVKNRRYRDNHSYQLAAKLTDEDMNFIVLKYGNVE